MSKLIRNNKNKNKLLSLKSVSLVIGVLFAEEYSSEFRIIILDQDESLRHRKDTEIYYTKKETFSIEIRSCLYPEFIVVAEEAFLYLRGSSRDNDYTFVSVEKEYFNTIFVPGLNEWKKVKIIENKNMIKNYIKECSLPEKQKYKFDKLLVM